MSVRKAVEAELKASGECGALGAVALELAAQLDAGGNSATSKANCAKVLAEVLGRIRELALSRPQGDKLDELRQRRDARVTKAKG